MANEINIKVKVDGNEAKAGVESVVQSTKKITKGVKEADESIGGFKKSLKDAGSVAAGVLTADIVQGAVTGIKNLAVSTIKAASDLNESTNAVQKVFGASAKGIEDWGKSNATAFGLSQRAFNELVTPLGAGLKNAGLGMQDVSKDTINLTKRAADMASVFNTSVPDALDAINAGLRGETDPLERYGVSLTAAAIQAEALAETHKSVASELTRAEIATARVNLIMKQTASTEGDFAQTSDQAANAQRVAAAKIEDAQAKIGKGLLPVLAKAAVLAGDAAQAFGNMPGPLQAMAAVTLVGGGAMALFGKRIVDGVKSLNELRTGALAAETRLGGMVRTVGKVATAFAALQVAGAALGRDASAGVDTTTKALEDLANGAAASSDVTKHLGYDLGTLASGGMAKVNKATATTIEQLTGLGGVFDNSIKHANERIGSMDSALATMVQNNNAGKAAAAFAVLTEEAKKQGVSVADLKKGFPQYQNALDGVANANKTAGEEAKTAADKTKDLATQMETLRTDASKASSAVLDSRSAARAFRQAIDDASTALKENGRSLSITTQKGRDNQAALDGVAEAALKQADAIYEATGSESSYRQSLSASRTALQRTAERFGMSRAEAHKYVDQVLRIPKSVSTSVKTPGLSGAISQLRTYASAIAKINGKVVTVHYRTDGSVVISSGGSRVTARESGGVVGAAQSGGIRSNRILVGEHGPEVVDLAPGSTVHSNPDSHRIMSSAYQPSPKIVIEFRSSGSAFDNFLVDSIRNAVRVRGGNVQFAFGR